MESFRVIICVVVVEKILAYLEHVFVCTERSSCSAGQVKNLTNWGLCLSVTTCAYLSNYRQQKLVKNSCPVALFCSLLPTKTYFPWNNNFKAYEVCGNIYILNLEEGGRFKKYEIAWHVFHFI